MYLIETADSTPLALVSGFARDADQDHPGIWCWIGFFEGATATPLTPGLVLRDWIVWDDLSDNRREDWTVVKVNRVTVKVKNRAGRESTIRVDR